MRARSLLPCLALLATACYGRGKFEEEYAEVLCTLEDECGFLEDYGSTMEACRADAVLPEDCDYDAATAQECVEAVERADCGGFLDGTAEGLGACTRVCSGGA